MHRVWLGHALCVSLLQPRRVPFLQCGTITAQEHAASGNYCESLFKRKKKNVFSVLQWQLFSKWHARFGKREVTGVRKRV